MIVLRANFYVRKDLVVAEEDGYVFFSRACSCAFNEETWAFNALICVSSSLSVSVWRLPGVRELSAWISCSVELRRLLWRWMSV